MAELEFWVNGMTCSHCESAITAELTTLRGVTRVQVESDSGRVQLVSDSPVTRTAVQRAVEDAGFELRSFPVGADV